MSDDPMLLPAGTAPQEVRDQHAEEKDRAGNADEGEEEIRGLFQGRYLGRFYGSGVDQQAEADAEEETYRLEHAAS